MKKPSCLAELVEIEELLFNDQPEGLRYNRLLEIEHQGQCFPVYALALGSQSLDKPSVTYVGGIHGLERIGTQVVLSFLKTLLARSHWDQHLAHVLEQVTLYFLPLMNPVGMLNHTRSNGQGIDLMRNAPVECSEQALWLGGGHRISSRLPWYRGLAGQSMEAEAQALCDFVIKDLFPRPFNLVLDCHSGFGFHNHIWFPYACSRLEAIPHLGEIFYLRQLFFQTYPYQNYRFEPQAHHYLTHGDLWDYLYQQSLAVNTTFVPLTLEMGSWRWIRKNPLQITRALGFFHPIKHHRLHRVLRGHLVLMDFLMQACASYQNWLSASHSHLMKQQALKLWYTHPKNKAK